MLPNNIWSPTCGTICFSGFPEPADSRKPRVPDSKPDHMVGCLKAAGPGSTGVLPDRAVLIPNIHQVDCQGPGR